MSTRAGSHTSYWMGTSPETSYPRVERDIEVDVAVVGGGIAGLCTAWELLRFGRSVAVLEADRIAASTTGHTTAKLSAQHTLIYAHLRRTVGAEGARLYAESQQDAIEHVDRTVRELDIDCDLERLPSFTYTESTSQAAVDNIRAEADAAGEAGLPASFETTTTLPYGISGAVKVEHQAQFHPRRYLLALVEKGISRGGLSVYEQTRVVGLVEGDPCRLALDNGATVTARDVVVATHYPIFDRALLFSRLEPHREVVVAAPIDADVDPGGMFITEDDDTRSVRTAPYGQHARLLIVTGEAFRPGTPGAGGTTERFVRLGRWTMERFGVTDIAYQWATQDNTSTDRMPYVGRLHPAAKHVYVAAGYGGWGMTNGVMSGRVLAAALDGEELPWSRLYAPTRLSPRREAGRFLKAQASVARHFVGDRICPSHRRSLAEVERGTGAVVAVRGKQYAVYRDRGGRPHALSARCTHLGCIVAYNDAERSWDCPCHGSRFALDGRILHGPATHPLERHELEE